MTAKTTFDGLQVFDVPETMYQQYHGAGYALVATNGGVLSAIKYLSDIDPDFDFDDDDLEEGESVKDRLEAIISDERIGNFSKLLSSFGHVHIGMMSCYQFVEL